MKKILMYALAATAVLGCTKTENPGSDSDRIDFILTYPETVKATDTGFESGDAINLFAVEQGGEETMPLQIAGNYLNNETLTFDGSKWTSSRSLYWSDKPCDFYAVYPRQTDIQTVDAYPFVLATDQNGEGYEASDLLFAKAEKVSRSNGAVNLTFKHLLSRLTVKLVKGERFEGEIPDDIVAHIYNTNVECSLNFNSGSVEKSAFGAKKTITMKKLSNNLFNAIIVPQNIEKRTPLIEITMGGIAYLLEYSLSFRAGYSHTVTLILNTSPDQEKIEISIDPSIDPM